VTTSWSENFRLVDTFDFMLGRGDDGTLWIRDFRCREEPVLIARFAGPLDLAKIRKGIEQHPFRDCIPRQSAALAAFIRGMMGISETAP
jgi:hypothetical protein